MNNNEKQHSLIGKTVNGYVFEEYLGNGGFGTVFRVYNPNTDMCLARKIMNAQALDDEYKIKLFMAEQGLLERLNHPRIVRLYGGGILENTGPEYDGYPYIDMELMRGGTLLEYIETNKGIDIVDILNLLYQVCEGVTYLHKEMDTVHLDITPMNILLAEDFHVKIADVGIAKSLMKQDRGSYTATKLQGKGHFRPPEIDLPGYDPMIQSDIFMLGGLLQFAIMGYAYSVFAPTQLKHRNVNSDIIDIIQVAMDPEPENRFQDCRELSERIDEAMYNIILDRTYPYLIKPLEQIVASKDVLKQKDYTTIKAIYEKIVEYEKTEKMKLPWEIKDKIYDLSHMKYIKDSQLWKDFEETVNKKPDKIRPRQIYKISEKYRASMKLWGDLYPIIKNFGERI
jgi:serine/threonine protein kinase